MRNKIAALTLVGLAYFSVCSFTEHNGTDNSATSEVASNPKDLDVQMILNGLGISTRVDQNAIDTKYPPVKLEVAGGKGINLGFYNPMAKPYSLDVFDTEGNLVTSVNNIIVAGVTLPENMFSKGSYIYKLTGEGNTYAGKFFYQ